MFAFLICEYICFITKKAIILIILEFMQRLGTCSSKPSDWEVSKAYYLRLTIIPSARVHRPEVHFPKPHPLINSESTDPIIMRHELLDLGHTDTYQNLCKLIKYVYLKLLAF